MFVQSYASEGSDRTTLGYGDQDAAVTMVAAHAKKTIVVASSPGAALMPWRHDVSAIIANFYGGQQVGHAVMDVLFGDVNPSGRLPVTFPNVENEIGLTQEMWPGVNGQATFPDKLNIGYRWYTTHGITPAFAFGHGLSYTTFGYSNLTVDGRRVTFDVTNTGDVDGAEVAQLYLTFPESADEPAKQLKGFSKVFLKAGETATVAMNIADRDVSIWDVSTHSFTVIPGEFDIMVGASSMDIRVKGTVVVKAKSS